MTEKEMVLSEEYVDFLLDAVLPESSIPQEGEYFYQTVDENLGIMYRSIGSMPLLNINSFTYQVIPGVYGLMQDEETEGNVPEGGGNGQGTVPGNEGQTGAETVSGIQPGTEVEGEAQSGTITDGGGQPPGTAVGAGAEGQPPGTAVEAGAEGQPETAAGNEEQLKPIDENQSLIGIPQSEGPPSPDMSLGGDGTATATTFDPTALIKTGIMEVQRPPLALTGRGVILGFVDTGIRYDDPVFRNPDGSSRILAIWDQNIQTGEPPAGIVYGTEYTREMIDQALASDNPRDIVPSYDENGHGTSIASVAAGSILDSGLTFHGAAPDADIVMVKLKQAKRNVRDFFFIAEEAEAYSEADIIMGIKYLESFAVSFQRPLVICLGLGSNMGDHTGSTALAGYLNRIAVKRSRAIVVCGGNEGNSEHHYYGELSHGPTDINYAEIEIRVDARERGFTAELWGNLPSTLSLSVRSPGGEVTEVVNFRSRERRSFSFVYVDTVVLIDYVLVEQNSGAQLIMIRFQNPAEGVWTLRVTSVDGTGEVDRFHIWLPISQFMTGNTYFLQPSPYNTLTEPSMAKEVITPSTYNDINNSFYAVTGRGFTRDGRIKPDISAPGANVDTILGKQSGSSLSAAITAGAAAQFMQWAVVEKHSIYAESRELKSYLIRGALRSQDTNYPNREWGAYGNIVSS